MKLTDGIYILNYALLAIVAVVLAFEVDNSDALSYLVGTFALLFCLVHISYYKGYTFASLLSQKSSLLSTRLKPYIRLP